MPKKTAIIQPSRVRATAASEIRVREPPDQSRNRSIDQMISGSARAVVATQTQKAPRQLPSEIARGAV